MSLSVVSAAAPTPALRLWRPADPAAALGLAVAHLMTRPAFARLAFGDWSRVLVGQVNRRHYRLAMDGRGRVVGFLGWALTDEGRADGWLQGRAFAGVDAEDGDCVVFNAWSAETRAVNRLLLRAAREVIAGRRLVYFRRSYPAGGARPVRMPVNDFVGAHLARPA